jgi:hypothetical protein
MSFLAALKPIAMSIGIISASVVTGIKIEKALSSKKIPKAMEMLEVFKNLEVVSPIQIRSKVSYLPTVPTNPVVSTEIPTNPVVSTVASMIPLTHDQRNHGKKKGN